MIHLEKQIPQKKIPKIPTMQLMLSFLDYACQVLQFVTSHTKLKCVPICPLILFFAFAVSASHKNNSTKKQKAFRTLLSDSQASSARPRVQIQFVFVKFICSFNFDKKQMQFLFTSIPISFDIKRNYEHWFTLLHKKH